MTAKRVRTAVVGLDFGKRIGCSFLLNGQVVDLAVHTRVSDAVKWMGDLIEEYKPQRVVVKLGNKYSSRFLRALRRYGDLPVEISLVVVDEHGTTKLGKGPGVDRHESSALNIALMAGELRVKGNKRFFQRRKV